MRILATLFVAVAALMWVMAPVQAAAPGGGGTSGSSGAAAPGSATGGAPSGAAQSQAPSGGASPSDLNPAEPNPMQEANPAGGNPATSTQEANTNPPGSNAPATGMRMFNNPGTGPGTGATINTPRGQIGIGANANGGLNVDVNRNAGTLPNTQLRQDLREDRQNFRQDLRTQRQDERQDNRQERLNDPNRWRYSYQNGEWWYWLPSNSWVYWRENRWMPYNADSYQPFGYRTGYRGAANNNSPSYFYDESGRRYRRDYSPLQPQNMEMQTGASNGAQGSMQQPNNAGESSRMSPITPSPQANEGGMGQ